MVVVFDVEATGAQRNKAHPFDKRNVACCMGFRFNGQNKIFKLEYDDEPYGDILGDIRELLSKATVLVGFNLKFDLHWLRRYNVSLPDGCRVFDCQLAYYILQSQSESYPALDTVAKYYGQEQKLDIVKTDYWDKGLDTNDVPYDILSIYLEQDLMVTEQVYNKLQEDYSNASIEMRKLINVSMHDLVVLEDIEWNGLLLDAEKSIKKGNELVDKINKIDCWLREVFGAPWFNPNSGDQLSVFLFGGVIELDGKEDYTFTYKDGRTAIKTRNIKVPYTSKGLFKPLEKTELAKEGFYSTDRATLITLRNMSKGEYKKILQVILDRSTIEKLRSTYYHGYPKKLEEYGWSDNIIHSNFNMCVAKTGRLTSTKPNVQNVEDGVNEVFITRF